MYSNCLKPETIKNRLPLSVGLNFSSGVISSPQVHLTGRPLIVTSFQLKHCLLDSQFAALIGSISEASTSIEDSGNISIVTSSVVSELMNILISYYVEFMTEKV